MSKCYWCGKGLDHRLRYKKYHPLCEKKMNNQLKKLEPKDIPFQCCELRHYCSSCSARLHEKDCKNWVREKDNHFCGHVNLDKAEKEWRRLNAAESHED